MNSSLRVVLSGGVCVAVCLSLMGCGETKVGYTIKGKVVQGGQPLAITDKDKILLSFNELKPDGATLGDNIYSATFNEEGTFEADVPAGKYRVEVKYLSPYPTDKLGGKYSQGTSPIVKDIAGSDDNMVIEVSP